MPQKEIPKKINIAESQFIKERDYWTKKLSGEPERSYFLYDYQKGLTQDHRERVEFKLSEKLFIRLMELSSGSAPKLHMILTAALVILLNKHTGNEDIIVATAIDKQEEDEGLINTILPLRFQVGGGQTFKELLLETRNIVNEAIKNQNYPIDTLLPRLKMDYEGEDFSLFDVSIILENIQDKKYIQHLNSSIIFSFLQEEECIAGEVEYRAGRYEKRSVERIIDYFFTVLQGVLFDVECKIGDIDILSPEDKRLQAEFNDTRADYGPDITIQDLFARQARQTPDNTAVLEAESGLSLTYRELENRAGRLADFLSSSAAHSRGIIGILMERSPQVVTAILGILKAGSAFLPIDHEYPPERIAYMLADSSTKTLVTTTGLFKKIEKSIDFEIGTIFLDEFDSIGDTGAVDRRSAAGRGDSSPGSAPAGKEPASAPAYVIYTSGSTGKPKGVMIEQRSLVNYVLWAAENYVKEKEVNFPLFTPISFDLTITSIFTPLITGNSVVIYGGWERGNVVEEIVDDNKVGVIKLTPSHLNLIRDKKIAADLPCKIKRFIVGGEMLDTRLARDIHSGFNGQVEIYNEYGPTEAAVGCMIHKFDPVNDCYHSVPIGVPAANTQIYVLDKKLRPLPQGAAGEMYIAGAGLAAGYLNRPELTAEKFANRSYKSNKSDEFDKAGKSYKTGDLARWLPGGILEFLGRRDQQVKVRGFRIELEEIESCLIEHKDIKQALVIDRDAVKRAGEDMEMGKELCAYIISDKKVDIVSLREYLFGRLPRHMVPTYFVQVETIPLTPHGKIDRKSLPDPADMIEESVEFQPPTTEKEKILTGIWQEVLGVEKVGIDDSYFSLGGDSINAIQIAARLQKFKLKLDLKYLYQSPTIRELADYLQSIKKVPFQGVVEGEARLTPIQEWFFEKKFPGKHHFNQSVLLHRPEGFDREKVRQVFDKLVEHHDALRMVFKMEAGSIKPFNRGLDGNLVDMEVFEIDRTPYDGIIREKCNQIQRSMDLSSGPLVKVGLFKTKAGDYLLIAIHHLIVDSVSFRILSEDFASLYKQLLQGKTLETVEIPLKSTSFKEWTEKLHEYSNRQVLLKELPFWKEVEETEFLSLAKNSGSRPAILKDMGRVFFELTVQDTEKLLKEVNRAYNTEINDILLSALAAALKNRLGEKVVIALEGHGREGVIGDVDITRTVGWFTTLYPVVLETGSSEDLGALVKNTKENLRRIPDKGLDYGVLKYLTTAENKQDILFSMKPEITFNYFGQFDRDIDDDVFSAAGIYGGDQFSPDWENEYLLTISGLVIRGRLKITTTFNKEAIAEEEVSTFIKQYEKKLLRIIEHCTQKEETELTVSDYSSAIDEQEAQLVFDVLGEQDLG